MNSSAVDARVVIAVEKILDAGCVIYSEKLADLYYFKITVPGAVQVKFSGTGLTELGESFDGYGYSFSEAFNDAYRQLPERQQSAAA